MNALPRIAALPAASPHLLRLIDSIGDAAFEAELLGFLNATLGAEHYALFGLDGAQPEEMAAVSLDGSDTAHKQVSVYIETELWRRDPAMEAARLGHGEDEPWLICLDIPGLKDRELREIVYPRTSERILLCGHSVVGRIGLSLTRREVTSPAETAAVLTDMAPLLLSLLGKHVSASWQRRNLLLALTSLPQIEACVTEAPERLPHREAQVCARIIYGVSSLGIALELGIGEETVLTYRKRIYQRLMISTQRELIIWYVALWSQDRQPGPPRARPLGTANVSAEST